MRFFFVAVILSVCPSSGHAEVQSAYDDRPKISVGGEALVYAQPNQIVLRFGIETWDIDMMAAKRKNNEILGKAIAVLRQSGAPDKAIQTDHLSIEPWWEDGYRREKLKGYVVRNTLAATITDPARVEGVITRVLQAGVNYIHGVDFQTTELKKHREEARQLALKAAREKAEKMAAALGRSVGNPIQISEGHMGSWLWSGWSGWGSSRGHGMSQNVVQSAPSGSGEASGTIALGKIEIRAGVNVVFELK